MSSYGKTISEYNLKQGGWNKTPNFGCFFIWCIECVEKKDFVQLITSMSNETESYFDTVTRINVKVESVCILSLKLTFGNNYIHT